MQFLQVGAAILNRIKEHLIPAPVLSCPDYDLPFVVQTDASDYGLGAVLTQTRDGEERVVCYLSRSLTAAERKYSTTEKECLALLFAVILSGRNLIWKKSNSR